nr:unnamed protein product [Callosobruchus chinensis]
MAAAVEIDNNLTNNCILLTWQEIKLSHIIIRVAIWIYCVDPRYKVVTFSNIDWWRRHENVFPNLVAMATDFFSQTRVFSSCMTVFQSSPYGYKNPITPQYC